MVATIAAQVVIKDRQNAKKSARGKDAIRMGCKG